MVKRVRKLLYLAIKNAAEIKDIDVICSQDQGGNSTSLPGKLILIGWHARDTGTFPVAAQ